MISEVSESSVEFGLRRASLGKTGIQIPRIGIGTWQYRGGPDLLRKAVDLGAWLIDTAEYYNNEEIVGQAIKGIRDQVFVATKVNHWKRDEVLRSAEASLRKLGVDCIDLYQLHWPNGAVPMEETMAAMEELVDQGKVRHLGVSNFAIHEMKRAQRALRKTKIVSNQVRYSLIERTIEPRLLSYCQERNITVLAYSPLGHSFARLRENDYQGVLGDVARESGKSQAQVALNWCLRHEGVAVLPKTESESHLAENCAAGDWRLSEAQIERLNRGVRYRRRGRLEAALRRLARNTLQRCGRM